MNKQRYSDETAARAYIAAQIKKGAMIRPEKCEKCGTVGPVHAHHHLGYEKKDWGVVQWLCTRCHGDAHDSNGGLPRGQGHGDPDSLHRIMTRIALTAAEYRQLRVISIRTDTPLTELIGGILSKWLRRTRNKSPLSVGESDDSM